jgi:beta-glucosidase
VRSPNPDERALAEANAKLYDDVIWTSWIRALRDGVLAVPGRAERVIDDYAGAFDLIGFSYYSATAVYADLSTGPYPTDARTGPLGDAPWAQGLGITIRRLHDELPDRPLVVAECGIGTFADDDDDAWRTEVLRDSLHQVSDAIDDGCDVRGFFHWTGVDNYEWTLGYDARFGIFDADRNPKGSAELARAWAKGTSP